jgi:hypothetical protein
MADNSMRLRRGDELLREEFARRGLYRRYHLMVAAVLHQTGATPTQLFASPPSEKFALNAAYRWRQAPAS